MLELGEEKNNDWVDGKHLEKRRTGEAQLKGADFFLDVMFYSHTNVLCAALLVTAF